MNVVNVSTWIKRQYARIPAVSKAAFYSAVIIAVVTHLTILTNRLINHDSVEYLYGKGDYLHQAKWFYFFLTWIRGGYSFYGIINPLAILFLSIVSAITVYILQIKNRIYSVIISGFIVAFPSVMTTFLYGAADRFFFALLLGSLAAFFTIQHKKWGWLPGIILLTLSLGTYAAYLGYVVGLFLILLLIKTISDQSKPGEILLEGIKYFFVVGVSSLLYYAILMICLNLTGTKLSGYLGISNVTSFNILNIPNLIAQTYYNVYIFFRYDYFGTSAESFRWVYRLTILINAVLMLLIILKSKVFKSINMLLVLLFGLLLPLGINIIAVLGQNPETHWLMKYSFVLFFILMIKLLETFVDLFDQNKENSVQINLKNIKNNLMNLKVATTRVAEWGVVILSIIIAFKWFLVTNQCYWQMYLAYEASYATAVHIATDIANMKNYSEYVDVVIIDDNRKIPNMRTDFEPLLKFTGVSGDEIFVDYRDYYAMINNFLAFEIERVDSKTVDSIRNTEQFSAMPYYPYYGYIRVIKDFIVVKVP